MEIINHAHFEQNPLEIMEQAIVSGHIQTISTPKGNIIIMSEEKYRAEMEMEPDLNEVRITHLDLGL